MLIFIALIFTYHPSNFYVSIYNYMAEAQKKHKGDKNKKGPDFTIIYEDIVTTSMSSDDHLFVHIL